MTAAWPNGLRIATAASTSHRRGSGRSAAMPMAAIASMPTLEMIAYRGANDGRVSTQIVTGTTTGTNISASSIAKPTRRPRVMPPPP